jgi:nitrous oxidase accessory protein
MYTHAVTMTENRFLDNRGGAAYGLLLKEFGDPVLVGNEFARNTVGLMADGATRLVAEHNTFADNGWGVRLMANVQDGRFTANDFAGNTFDVATNGGGGDAAAFDGNWFDDYRGYDLDRDGRGDVPHRPVRLFSLLVARYETALVLQRGFFVGLLDGAERAIPSLTPRLLADPHPAMRPVARATRAGRSANSRSGS